MDVAANLSTQGLIDRAEIVLLALKNELGMPSPRFGMCGLNPHAGEDGVLGREEIEIIGPACDALREAGHCVIGPIFSETAF